MCPDGYYQQVEMRQKFIIDAEMKTRVEGVASCETPPVLPRNSPPLQASARPGRKESFFDALTLSLNGVWRSNLRVWLNIDVILFYLYSRPPHINNMSVILSYRPSAGIQESHSK